MSTRLRSCAANPCVTGGVAFLLTVLILLSHYAVKYGLNTPPSTSGDEVSYDRIGWNLAHGAGFAEGGNDPRFYRPYDQVGAYGPEHVAGRPYSQTELIAYRPPLFPVALAALNKVCGRQFWAVRTLNVAATAVTCGMLVWYLTKTQGHAAALISVVMFLVVDTRTRLYGRAILTEATAMCLTTVATVLLIRLADKVRLRTVMITGFVAGLLILDRTLFSLWLPGMAVIVFVLGRRTSSDSFADRPTRRRFAGIPVTLAFLAVTMLVVLPWAVRNIVVLGAVMPLGTQGMTQLPAGFSDHAVEVNGVWDSDPAKRLALTIESGAMTRLERDVARARLGQSTAFKWIRQNPGTSIRLAGMKVWQEYRPRIFTEWFIGLSALGGLMLSTGRRDTRLFVALHAVNCIAIGCTWSVEGRFVVPLMFSIHVLAATALAYPVRAVRRLLPRFLPVVFQAREKERGS